MSIACPERFTRGFPSALKSIRVSGKRFISTFTAVIRAARSRVFCTFSVLHFPASSSLAEFIFHTSSCLPGDGKPSTRKWEKPGWYCAVRPFEERPAATASRSEKEKGKPSSTTTGHQQNQNMPSIQYVFIKQPGGGSPKTIQSGINKPRHVEPERSGGCPNRAEYHHAHRTQNQKEQPQKGLVNRFEQKGGKVPDDRSAGRYQDIN